MAGPFATVVRVIHLLCPLSLPLAGSAVASAFPDEARQRSGVIQAVTAALRDGGLHRARRCAWQAEPEALQPALAHERWIQSHLRLPAPDMANVSGLLSKATQPPPWPAGSQGWLLRPVTLQLGLDHLVLAGDETNPTTLDAPQAWATLLQDALEPGWSLVPWSGPGNETFFVLGTPSRLDWQPRSGLQAAGRSIDAYLPQGSDARQWRRFLNHAQMLLHEHPLNEARLASGRPVINGLWLEGRQPPANSGALLSFSLADLNGPAVDGLTASSGIALVEDWIPSVRQADQSAWLKVWGEFPARAKTLRTLRVARSGGLAWHFFGEGAHLGLIEEPGNRFKFWRSALPELGQ